MSVRTVWPKWSIMLNSFKFRSLNSLKQDFISSAFWISIQKFLGDLHPFNSKQSVLPIILVMYLQHNLQMYNIWHSVKF